MTSRRADGILAALRFWGRVVAETLGGRRLDRVIAARLGGEPVHATGAELLPRDGAFVFAVNHLRAGLTMGTIAAVLDAAARVRPGVARECQLVVGMPAGPPAGRVAGMVRRVMARFWARWAASLVRVPLASGAPDPRALRAFRARAASGRCWCSPRAAPRRSSARCGPARARGSGASRSPSCPSA